MSIAGWLTMSFSIAGVVGIAVWAYYRVLTDPDPADSLTSPNPPLPEEQGDNS